MLVSKGDKYPDFKVSFVQVTGDDVVINFLSTVGKVTLDKESFKLFKKHPFYKQLKRWVKRK